MLKAQSEEAKDSREKQSLTLQREALSNNILNTEREWQTQERERLLGAPNKISTGPADLPGNDMGGTIARDKYGMIPGAAQ